MTKFYAIVLFLAVLFLRPLVAQSQINASPIQTNSLTISTGSASFVQGYPYTISYSSSGYVFNSGNTLTVQLSDASGSFANTTSIGLANTTSTSGTIPVVVPSNASGTSYRMRIVSSTTAVTGSDNGSNLTVTAAPTNALHFDGIDDYVAIGSPLAAGSSYTKEAWVYPTNAASARNIVSSDSNPFWFTQGKLCAGNGTNYSVVSEPSTTALNTWTHVAVTYDAATATMRLYKDGVLVGTGTNAPVPPAEAVFIGSHNGTLSYFEGAIDEVRVWNRALCPTEIQNNMNGLLPTSNLQNGLIRSYDFNQGAASGTNTSITALPDRSVSGSTGTLTNFSRTGATSNFVTSTVATTTATAYQSATAGASNSSTQMMYGATSFYSNCDGIAVVSPTGSQPVSGSVSARVWIESNGPTYNGAPYLARHYEITPATNATTATGTITLFYTQAEFTGYNAAANHGLNLPVDATDAQNYKANLRITKKSGTSSNGTGLPGTYNNGKIVIIPTSVTWNASTSRWEVVLPVTGFSGFFASTSTTALPVKVLSFTARRAEQGTELTWQVAAQEVGTTYQIERSSDGNQFTALDEIASREDRSAYQYLDNQLLNGTHYYRLRITETSGEFAYSSVVVVRGGKAFSGTITIAPQPAADFLTVTTTDPGLEGTNGTVLDIQGREVTRFKLERSKKMDISNWLPGLYLMRLSNGEVLRIIKQ